VGRPARNVNPGEVRQTIRWTKREASALRKLAAAAKLPVADFVRRRALGQAMQTEISFRRRAGAS